jgi:hypothetical protein
MATAQNARLHEVWFDTAADGAGTPVLRKVALAVRPGLMVRAMSERLLRRLDADQIEQPLQIEINAPQLHGAVRASRGRSVRTGDRLTILDLSAGGGPARASYRHLEVISIDTAADLRPGGIERITIGCKAAVAPEGSVAAKSGGRS